MIDFSKGIPMYFVDQLASMAPMVAKEFHGLDLGTVEVVVFECGTGFRVEFRSGGNISMVELSGDGLADMINPQSLYWDAIMQDFVVAA